MKYCGKDVYLYIDKIWDDVIDSTNESIHYDINRLVDSQLWAQVRSSVVFSVSLNIYSGQ